MSEKLKFESEAARSPERQVNHEVSHHNAEKQPEARHESASDTEDRLASLREKVGEEAQSSDEVLKTAPQQEKNTSNGPVKRELQDLMLARTLTRIRKELPFGQRTLSKVVHNKPVEIISAAGEKTIARPYGLLGGGLAAFIGSTFTFYTAKHYGFRYSFILFFILFIGGYVVATLLEIIFRTLRRAK